jgi:hypothetical protein
MDEQKELSEEQVFEGMFFSLVLSLSTAAMSQMGKLANPISQKIERNLVQAKNSIEMLRMLRAKTQGNLGENENQFVERTISELQLNYLDEVKKGDDAPAVAEATDSPEAVEEKVVVAEAPPEAKPVKKTAKKTAKKKAAKKAAKRTPKQEQDS